MSARQRLTHDLDEEEVVSFMPIPTSDPHFRAFKLELEFCGDECGGKEELLKLAHEMWVISYEEVGNSPRGNRVAVVVFEDHNMRRAEESVFRSNLIDKVARL